MTIWKPETVSSEPITYLTSFEIFEVNGHRHFAGYVLALGEGRTSSPIQSWDAEKRIGITRSGRQYHIDDRPGLNSNALYVWQSWCKLNNIDINDVKKVTEEYMP